MTELKLYERLLELPLFQGMSRNDLGEAVSLIKFRQIDFSKNKTVITEGDVCDRLFFLLKGSVLITGYSDDKGYSVTEQLTAPDIIQPEHLFGLTQRHSITMETVTECSFICINKPDVVVLSTKYEIFRLNFLNMICTRLQRLTRVTWQIKPQSIRRKILKFISSKCIKPAGEKIVAIKMERLAAEIGESRLNVSKELNDMDTEGLISSRRGKIYVKALEKLN